jgi:hypothetical protein
LNLDSLKKQVRGYFTATLHSAPWIAFAVLGYLFLFSSVKNADLNLAFQAYKVCWAMVLTSLCDRGLFWMVPQDLESLAWAPQIRRSILFVGLCLLLQIA